MQLFCIQDKTQDSVAFKIQDQVQVNGVVIRTLNIQHAALTFLLTLNQLRLQNLPYIQYIHIHTQQAFTLALVRRWDGWFPSHAVTGENEQQCVSVTTCPWWGTGVLKWLPAGAFIININSRSLLSCIFSIQLTMLSYGPKLNMSNLRACLPFHLQASTFYCASSSSSSISFRCQKLAWCLQVISM